MPGGTLYVYVPGIGTDHSEAMRRRILDRAEQEAEATGSPAPVLKVFTHRIKAWSTRESYHLGTMARNLEESIKLWHLQTGATDVVLIGHSMGGLLVRSAWLLNRGYDIPWGGERGGIRRDDTGWAANTSRIILLGVPNGGFVLKKRSWRLLYAVATPWRDYTVEQAKEGGYWVTNLRLRWLHAFRELSKNAPDGAGDPRRVSDTKAPDAADSPDSADSPVFPASPYGAPVSVDQTAPAPARLPYVVEILGQQDTLVGDADVGDSDFLPSYREPMIPDTDHAQLVDLRDPKTAADRWWVLEHALFAPPEPVTVAPTVDCDVCFILHGIRAGNKDPWISDTAAALEAKGWEVLRPNTGWFSAWEFALPWVRNRKTHEFLTIYGDIARNHDMNRFAFFGHSNGTYMVARALDQVPAIRFRRMLLAGTVLTPEYNWRRVFARQQVGAWNSTSGRWVDGVVHNDRASRDVPVGMLCSFLSGLRFKSRSIGPGGVVGFVNSVEGLQEDDLLYKGGHAAALKTGAAGRLDQIVGFLADGRATDAPDQRLGGGFRVLINLLGSRWAILVLLVFLALFVLLFWWLTTFLPLWVPLAVFIAFAVVVLIGLRVV